MKSALMDAIGSTVLLLSLAIAAVLASRALRTSPIVGYLLLGIVLNAADFRQVASSSLIATFANLGVIFLLFDLGLHFPLQQIRERASDIFGLGAVQVALGTAALGSLALATGSTLSGAVMLGGTLALSSTAVVARVIADRGQQDCPVGQTATAILIFQDVAGILMLVVATALGGGASMAATVAAALLKASIAFGATIMIARTIVRPLFDIVTRTCAEEAFTATALFFSLGTGWVSGKIGLSFTLGAFLGGVSLADTPYRHTVASEIKPFRGLLLGLFFISTGTSLDLPFLVQRWPLVVSATCVLLCAKTATNIASGLAFRWSVPGSIQLGFLIAQGSEFALVLLAVPAVRDLIGTDRSALAVAAVVLSLVLTPGLATMGRTIAGRLRRRHLGVDDCELKPLATAQVLIVGMGRRGRALADALEHFGIAFAAVERDPGRLKAAIADGYPVVFGNMADPRLWSSVSARERKFSVLTGPSFEDVEAVSHFAQATHPGLRRIAAVGDAHGAARLKAAGVEPIVDATPIGLDLTVFILQEMGVDDERIAGWQKRAQARKDAIAAGALEAA